MSLPYSYTLRVAGVADAQLIQSQREAMFTEMGEAVQRLERVRAVGEQWLHSALVGGRYTGFLVETGQEVIAGAGLLWQDMPPNAQTARAVRAYLLNVYVSPPHRGQALARTLVQVALTECRKRGIDIVTLTASEAGRPTYERLGFGVQSEMKLLLTEQGDA